MYNFTYEKPNGDISKRSTFVLREPTDLMLTIDLTEFTVDEQEYYEKQLNSLVESMKAEISNLGLDRNYRAFKKGRIK